MNLLHALVYVFIQNYSAVADAISGCFHFGVLVSHLTALAGMVAAGRLVVRRVSRHSL